MKRSAEGIVAAAAASLLVEVNTSNCAVPGGQLGLPGAPQQRKTGEKKTDEEEEKQREKTKTEMLLS